MNSLLPRSQSFIPWLETFQPKLERFGAQFAGFILRLRVFGRWLECFRLRCQTDLLPKDRTQIRPEEFPNLFRTTWTGRLCTDRRLRRSRGHALATLQAENRLLGQIIRIGLGDARTGFAHHHQHPWPHQNPAIGAGRDHGWTLWRDNPAAP